MIMSNRSSKSVMVRLHLQLIVVLLPLLSYAPPNTLVNGQLEAVGAVLSVVPVTSILATAGLVGVKLAALSRLLNILGYDRAYLAQNLGTGTAAAPIGLQTRYAYMFPYVPGLNISVKGDDSIGMPKEAVTELAEDGTKVGTVSQVSVPKGPPRRKTYPAMSLPADYEKQPKPFRGSEALKDIFTKVGIQAYIPTTMQQQQLQQQFNLPPQGNDQTNNNNNNNYNQQYSNMHLSSFTTNANDNDPNRNDKQLQQHQQPSHILLPQQQPTYKDQPLPTTNDHHQNQQPQQHDSSGSLLSNQQSSLSVIPSNVAPNRATESHNSANMASQTLTTTNVDTTIAANTPGDNQPANKPSSLNSHQNHPNQPTSSSNSNQSPQPGRGQAAGTATQQQQQQQQQHHLRHFQIQF